MRRLWHKRITAFFTGLLLFALAPFAVGQSASVPALKAQLAVDVACDTAQISPAGTVGVTLTFHVQNGMTGQKIEVMFVTIAGEPYLLSQQVGAQTSVPVHIRSVSVDSDDLAKNIPVNVVYTDFDGSSVTKELSVSLQESEPMAPAPTVELAFFIDIAPKNPAMGEKVSVTYNVKNETDVDVANLAVYEGETMVGEAQAFAPGQEARFTYNFTMGESATLTPALSADLPASGAKLSQNLTPTVLVGNTAGLEVIARSDADTVQSGEHFTLTLSVRNAGHDQMQDLQLSGGVLYHMPAFPQTLAPGESWICSIPVTPAGEREYVFKVWGESETGEEIYAASAPFTVKVTGGTQDDAILEATHTGLALNVQTQVQGAYLGESVGVQVQLVTMESAFTDVVIFEKSAGIVARFDRLAQNTQRTVDYLLPITQENGSYEFFVSALRDDGETVSDYAAPLTIVAYHEALPIATNAFSPQTTAAARNADGVQTALFFALGALFLLGCAGVVWFVRRERQDTKK